MKGKSEVAKKTSSNDSKISMLGWWMVQTIVLPVSTIFRTVLMTIAAALASSPEVGSSMNTIEGFATSSTAIVSLFLCSVDRPSTPGIPTKAALNEVSSTSSMTSSTNLCTSHLWVTKKNWNCSEAGYWLDWVSSELIQEQTALISPSCIRE